MYLHLMIDLIGSPRISSNFSSNMAIFQNDNLKGTCLQISFSKSDDLASLDITQLNHHVQIKHPHKISSQTKTTTGQDPKIVELSQWFSAMDALAKFRGIPRSLNLRIICGASMFRILPLRESIRNPHTNHGRVLLAESLISVDDNLILD